MLFRKKNKVGYETPAGAFMYANALEEHFLANPAFDLSNVEPAKAKEPDKFLSAMKIVFISAIFLTLAGLTAYAHFVMHLF